MNEVVSIFEQSSGSVAIKTIDTTLSIPFTVIEATHNSFFETALYQESSQIIRGPVAVLWISNTACKVVK